MDVTLLFRFRDLSCPSGETIKRHQAICDQKDFVWWGWWNKGHEKLPTETIQELGLHKELTDFFVYLFDSASKKFYQAELLKIKSNLGEKLKTDSLEHTPSYYVENSHQLWLKFKKIAEVEENEIIGLKSYEPMNDLFLPDSHFDMYDNKVVSSPEELAEQNRTIWKIRDKKETDKTNEIRLKFLTEVQPRHFDRSYRATSRNSILWLSDPHFTNDGFHEFALNDDNPNLLTLSKVIDGAYFKSDTHQIASLLISGDLTWKGLENEFKLASKFIDYIHSMNSMDKSWLSICPGNHDLSFYEGADDAIKNNDKAIKENYARTRQCYGDFYSKFFDINPNKSMASGRRFLLNDTIPVEIVLLNSVTLQQTKDSFQGHGFIGSEQLTEVENRMGLSTSKPRNVTRICVMHHHLLPVSLTQDAYEDAKYSTVLDAERLSRWLTTHKFDFLLHGHMHQNFNCTIERGVITHEVNPNEKKNKLHVLSLGSSGVCSSHTGEANGNWACRIAFGHDKIRFHYAKISPKDANLTGEYTLEFDYND
ncbi:metallophosphoesterase family protein [Shewanella nanhaiensis]|uniref:Metallophosphoesterase n=1 Tax=Shewanella nanhaiensis TaxID=2864872 RepID=A0ABS7E781_9GAMM|nr:metallophosphoesterase [Shewanella nanhaiensis]MBW8185505.1 metallophosphoesterase [Shewanella nanhaiensis]